MQPANTIQLERQRHAKIEVGPAALLLAARRQRDDEHTQFPIVWRVHDILTARWIVVTPPPACPRAIVAAHVSPAVCAAAAGTKAEATRVDARHDLAVPPPTHWRLILLRLKEGTRLLVPQNLLQLGLPLCAQPHPQHVADAVFLLHRLLSHSVPIGALAAILKNEAAVVMLPLGDDSEIAVPLLRQHEGKVSVPRISCATQ
mmetsp:Transcript_93517/g.273826  ORF Transcript_93517/g.273826 Transcript_93517/m.273826 type:complete len:202 (+) Transcript_93517:162-767(+)